MLSGAHAVGVGGGADVVVAGGGTSAGGESTVVVSDPAPDCSLDCSFVAADAASELDVPLA